MDKHLETLEAVEVIFDQIILTKSCALFSNDPILLMRPPSILIVVSIWAQKVLQVRCVAQIEVRLFYAHFCFQLLFEIAFLKTWNIKIYVDIFGPGIDHLQA